MQAKVDQDGDRNESDNTTIQATDSKFEPSIFTSRRKIRIFYTRIGPISDRGQTQTSIFALDLEMIVSQSFFYSACQFLWTYFKFHRYLGIILHYEPGVGRRNESCRHKWLFLSVLNGHFWIFTLQIFCFCRHMWRPLARLCEHSIAINVDPIAPPQNNSWKSDKSQQHHLVNDIGNCTAAPGEWYWQLNWNLRRGSRGGLYSGSQSHTTRRGRASCSLCWYASVASVCDLLLFLDEKKVIPEIRYFWKVTSPVEELFTVLYFPSDAFPMTWHRKLFTGLNSTGMMVTWLRTSANTRP